MATTAAGLEPGSPFGPSIEALAVYLRGLDQQRPFIEVFNTLILKRRRGIVMYGRPRCCKGKIDLNRR